MSTVTNKVDWKIKKPSLSPLCLSLSYIPHLLFENALCKFEYSPSNDMRFIMLFRVACLHSPGIYYSFQYSWAIKWWIHRNTNMRISSICPVWAVMYLTCVAMLQCLSGIDILILNWEGNIFGFVSSTHWWNHSTDFTNYSCSTSFFPYPSLYFSPSIVFSIPQFLQFRGHQDCSSRFGPWDSGSIWISCQSNRHGRTNGRSVRLHHRDHSDHRC